MAGMYLTTEKYSSKEKTRYFPGLSTLAGACEPEKSLKKFVEIKVTNRAKGVFTSGGHEQVFSYERRTNFSEHTSDCQTFCR